MRPMCQLFTGGGQALSSLAPAERSCGSQGWCLLMPDGSRRLLGSVLSSPLFAQSTGQAQCAQKCAECQLCTGEMENAVRSHKKWNMDLNFFIFHYFPRTGRESYGWPTDTEPGRFTLNPLFIYLFKLHEGRWMTSCFW